MKQQALSLSHSRPTTQQQTGAALIIGLVLLIALTIIGIGSLSTTSLEHRMAGNMGDLNLAFNASETASRAIQQIITPLTAPPAEQDNCGATATNNLVLCIKKKDTTTWWDGKDHVWWTTNATELAGTGTINEVKTQPHAVVENLQFIPDVLGVGHEYVTKGTQYYRITSRGTGLSNKSQAIVQQTVVKRFN